jgi:hypothetical protein
MERNEWKGKLVQQGGIRMLRAMATAFDVEPKVCQKLFCKKDIAIAVPPRMGHDMSSSRNTRRGTPRPEGCRMPVS